MACFSLFLVVYQSIVFSHMKEQIRFCASFSAENHNWELEQCLDKERNQPLTVKDKLKRELKAFSRSGYTEGAKLTVVSNNVDLYTLKDISD